MNDDITYCCNGDCNQGRACPLRRERMRQNYERVNSLHRSERQQRVRKAAVVTFAIVATALLIWMIGSYAVNAAIEAASTAPVNMRF